ncbi:sulfatase-like hydrolase/transferase [Opitutales bacterium]|nr:sulfatase-like hydrolase/transferase [Opitutales bacterium]
MKRTTILLSLCILFSALAAVAADKPPAVSLSNPNVLFIAIDDLNDWTGMLEGNSQARTPNMDKLASKGMLFTNAHCAAPASEKLFKMGESAIVYRLTLCAHLCLLIARSETSKR